MAKAKKKAAKKLPLAKKAGKRRIKRLGPVQRAKNFNKLRAMKCWPEVDRRVREGWPPLKLAHWIQDEAGEYTDAAVVTVEAQLRYYRDSLPATEVLSPTVPRYVRQKMDEVEQGISEIQELEKLYKLQMERVHIDFALEKTWSKLVPSMTQEIRAAREILSTIAELKMDMGLHERNLGTVNMDARIEAHVTANFGSARVAKVLADPEKRQRLTGLVKLLAKKADIVGSKVVIDVPVDGP